MELPGLGGPVPDDRARRAGGRRDGWPAVPPVGPSPVVVRCRPGRVGRAPRWRSDSRRARWPRRPPPRRRRSGGACLRRRPLGGVGRGVAARSALRSAAARPATPPRLRPTPGTSVTDAPAARRPRGPRSGVGLVGRLARSRAGSSPAAGPGSGGSIPRAGRLGDGSSPHLVVEIQEAAGVRLARTTGPAGSAAAPAGRGIGRGHRGTRPRSSAAPSRVPASLRARGPVVEHRGPTPTTLGGLGDRRRPAGHRPAGVSAVTGVGPGRSGGGAGIEVELPGAPLGVGAVRSSSDPRATSSSAEHGRVELLVVGDPVGILLPPARGHDPRPRALVASRRGTAPPAPARSGARSSGEARWGPPSAGHRRLPRPDRIDRRAGVPGSPGSSVRWTVGWSRRRPPKESSGSAPSVALDR